MIIQKVSGWFTIFIVNLKCRSKDLLWEELGSSENSQNWDPGSGCGNTDWVKPNRGRKGCLGRDGLVTPPITRSDCLRIQYRGVKSGQHCTNYMNAILRVWLIMTKNLPIEEGKKFGWYGSTSFVLFQHYFIISRAINFWWKENKNIQPWLFNCECVSGRIKVLNVRKDMENVI